jgi:hypothetical protein
MNSYTEGSHKNDRILYPFYEKKTGRKESELVGREQLRSTNEGVKIVINYKDTNKEDTKCIN